MENNKGFISQVILVVIILLIVAGGTYYFLKKSSPAPANNPATNSAPAMVNSTSSVQVPAIGQVAAPPEGNPKPPVQSTTSDLGKITYPKAAGTPTPAK